MNPGDTYGRWTVQERLGTGGAADVYRCTDGDEEAAIKLLRSVDPSDQQHRRLQREADILLRLSHPNIVKVRSIDLNARPAWLEMEFVRGQHAGHLIRAGAAAPRTLRAVAEQLLEAMAYWHAQDIAHRDIKPGNLIVGPDGKLTVVDFNLALDASLERLSGIGVRVGTFAYAPPEWIMEEAGDPRGWDVYGAGQVLWELAVGRRAFDAKLPMTQLMRSKMGINSLDPGERVAGDLRALILSLTARNPAERPADGAEALARLKP
ncbi:MAG: serine/threonine protein kinase [Myxococcales bacterium]|nr:serine/threonine protein kinase [Myxococcales bacterium]